MPGVNIVPPPVDRLLVVAPNWLGDAVMALPAIADVRRASPSHAREGGTSTLPSWQG